MAAAVCQRPWLTLASSGNGTGTGNGDTAAGREGSTRPWSSGPTPQLLRTEGLGPGKVIDSIADKLHPDKQRRRPAPGPQAPLRQQGWKGRV